MSNIMDTIEKAGTLGKLVAGLQATGLADLLKGAGPFTVFAPTDEAFSKLAPGTFAALLTDVPRLKSILTGHIVAGQIMVEDVMKLDSLQSVDNQHLTVKNTNTLTINDAKIVQADVKCSNGVLHIVDGVIVAV